MGLVLSAMMTFEIDPRGVQNKPYVRLIVFARIYYFYSEDVW